MDAQAAQDDTDLDAISQIRRAITPHRVSSPALYAARPLKAFLKPHFVTPTGGIFMDKLNSFIRFGKLCGLQRKIYVDSRSYIEFKKGDISSSLFILVNNGS